MALVSPPAGKSLAVRLDGLTKRCGRHRGVESLSLEVRRRQVLGFLGPNGAGKSTTIRLIMGLSRPSAGLVEVLGSPPQEGVALRRRVGYLPGELALFAEVANLDLRLRRRSVCGYALGVGAYAVLILVLYPSFRSDASLDQLAQGNPTMAALLGLSGSLTSPAGWLNGNLYANAVPLFALLRTVGPAPQPWRARTRTSALGGSLRCLG